MLAKFVESVGQNYSKNVFENYIVINFFYPTVIPFPHSHFLPTGYGLQTTKILQVNLRTEVFHILPTETGEICYIMDHKLLQDYAESCLAKFALDLINV